MKIENSVILSVARLEFNKAGKKIASLEEENKAEKRNASWQFVMTLKMKLHSFVKILKNGFRKFATKFYTALIQS